MREIEFRGILSDGSPDRFWVFGDLLKEEGNPCINAKNSDAFSLSSYESGEFVAFDGYAAAVLPETVGQYTGLTDKNGNKIYEGDIVKPVLNDGVYKSFEFPVGVVSFEDYAFGVLDKRKEFTPFYAYNSNVSIEVIGNIYDSPELMEA